MTHEDRPERESGAGSGTGQSADKPSTSQKESSHPSGGSQEIPIGYPVSSDELKQRKRDAERPSGADTPEKPGED
jgi:hypothetical protein